MLISHPEYWQLRTRRLRLGTMPLLMGIVNVTPDSFSDGGRFLDPDLAAAHALRLAAAGADILDIGGASTRPGAKPIDADEELRRVAPVLQRLQGRSGVPLSIDTAKAAVARKALDLGVEIINDISALTADAAMLPLAAESGCGVCLMHMRGAPATMQDNPVYADATAEVLEYLRGRRDAAIAAGVRAECVAVDPGIGFGKTMQHNLELIRNARRLHELGCPLMFGPSRKRFIGELIGGGAAAAEDVRPVERVSGTIGVALALARAGVQVLRVHDVAAVRQALTLFEASGGLA